eukprot:15119155-Alexandrium_andersonii.AAC.1
MSEFAGFLRLRVRNKLPPRKAVGTRWLAGSPQQWSRALGTCTLQVRVLGAPGVRACATAADGHD